MDKVQIHDYKGYTINIFWHEDPEDPREWESPFEMVCAHKRYKLGDVQHSPEGAESWRENMAEYFATKADVQHGYYMTEDEIDRVHRWIDGHILWLPLYLYDHSGISMSTGSFNGRVQHARWDSGTVGFIWISRKEARKYWSWKRISEKREEKLYEYMRNDVETYDQYLRGDVFGYIVDAPNGEENIDSCWGFFGYDEWDDNGLFEHAKGYVDWHIRERQKQHNEAVKKLIKNRVPLHFREERLRYHDSFSL